MDDRRLAELRKLEENTKDPVERADLEAQRLREWYGSYGSDEYDSQSIEMWGRVLSASIQPPLSAVEARAERSLVDPRWLREVCRGTREDVRRLLPSGHRKSRSVSTSRSSALAGWDPTTLGSNAAVASSGLAEQQEPFEEAEGQLRTQR